MTQSFWKKVQPHLIAIGIFLLVAIVFASPALQGKVVEQHDTKGWIGMAQQSMEFREQHGHFPLWSNSMFGGMPAYTFAMEVPAFQIYIIQTILTLGLPAPISYFFLASICFYLLCQVLGIRLSISILGAIAFAYSTYDPIIIAVGHNTKMLAISYAPAVLGSILLIFKKKYWAGTALLAVFSGLMIGTQHIQIVYYTLIMVLFMTVAFIVHSVRKGETRQLVKPLLLSAFAGAIGFANYAVMMLPVQEYTQETMRGGGSELTKNNTTRTKGGLDKDYAFLYGSYGIGETFTILVPRLYGGGAPSYVNNDLKSEFGENTQTAETLTRLTGMGEDQANDFVKQLPAYWGEQPGHAGPVYLGAVIVFLLLFACIYLKSWHKYWVIPVSIIAIIMAWGKNFSSVNYFLFDYLPMYNKFRAPAMSLVIPQLLFPMLAALGLEQLASGTDKKEYVWKQFRTALTVTGILFAGLILFYFSADFSNSGDAELRSNLSNMMLQQAGPNATPQIQQQADTFGQSVVKSLQQDRRSLFGNDLLRSFIFITIAAVLIGMLLKEKIKPQYALLGVLLAGSFDVFQIGRRYLSQRNFVEKSEFQTIQPNSADLQIKQDTQYPYRVFDQADPGGTFNSSRASYFHNSIGGYSPVKLELYQDLIENQISKNNMEVLNMLNTRYFILNNPANNQPVAQLNQRAFGPAWFVKNIHFVQDADAEMKSLDSLPLRDMALVQKKFEPIAGQQPQFDSTATIQWIENLNDKITYKTSAQSPQFAVFSEIYYPKGWNAYIDGVKTEYCKTNYVLRGMSIPAGEHTVEFRFEPTSYAIGSRITIGATGVTFALLLLAAFATWKESRKQTAKIS